MSVRIKFQSLPTTVSQQMVINPKSNSSEEIQMEDTNMFFLSPLNMHVLILVYSLESMGIHAPSISFYFSFDTKMPFSLKRFIFIRKTDL